MASSPLPTRTCIACEMNDTTERWLRMHVVTAKRRRVVSASAIVTTTASTIPILNYLLMHYYHRLWVHTTNSRSHSARAPHRNRNECNANRNRVVWLLCVGWRWWLALDSFKISCTNGLAHHRIRTAVAANNRFYSKLNGKLRISFYIRLTLT